MARIQTCNSPLSRCLASEVGCSSAHQLPSGCFPETLPARVFLDGRNTRRPANLVHPGQERFTHTAAGCRNTVTPRPIAHCACRRGETPNSPFASLKEGMRHSQCLACLLLTKPPLMGSQLVPSPNCSSPLSFLQTTKLVPSFKLWTFKQAKTTESLFIPSALPSALERPLFS